jgi:S-disulfanyl-L-cysteine oxidoreductase SoxD
MRFRIVLLATVGGWLAAASYAALQAQQPPSPAAASQAATTASPAGSVQEGVYTEEQAKRGAAIYEKECSSCHGSTMEGLDMAPPLSGAAFIANWNGLTVGDLFERIRLSMPQDDPGRLSRQQDADVLAFILSVNKFPAGKSELARETEPLKQIRFETAKSQD